MYWLKKQPGFNDKFQSDTEENPDQLIVRLKGSQDK